MSDPILSLLQSLLHSWLIIPSSLMRLIIYSMNSPSLLHWMNNIPWSLPFFPKSQNGSLLLITDRILSFYSTLNTLWFVFSPNHSTNRLCEGHQNSPLPDYADGIWTLSYHISPLHLTLPMVLHLKTLPSILRYQSHGSPTSIAIPFSSPSSHTCILLFFTVYPCLPLSLPYILFST